MLDPVTKKYDESIGNDLWDRGENHIISKHLLEFTFFGGTANAKVLASMKQQERTVEVGTTFNTILVTFIARL